MDEVPYSKNLIVQSPLITFNVKFVFDFFLIIILLGVFGHVNSTDAIQYLSLLLLKPFASEHRVRLDQDLVFDKSGNYSFTVLQVYNNKLQNI